MIIILPEHAGEESIKTALAHANEYFHDNLIFKGIEKQKTRRDKREVFKVTLTVKDSKEIGSRRSPHDFKRIAAACWHAHGVFFDSLPSGTEIRIGWTGMVMQSGEPWKDYNIGSQVNPCMASDACNCSEWNTSGVMPFPVNV